jgi:predicted DNA-binding antitoxin AbrB/MazE fold protein
MTEIITATFENGVLRPDTSLNLPSGAKVQLTVTACKQADEVVDDLDELDRLCEQNPIDSGGVRLTRDQLHERD